MAYNSTIITKKRKLSCGCFDYAFSKNMCKTHATILSTKKRMDKAAEREEEDGLPELIKELDGLCSKYVRLMAIEADGLVSCYTCDARGRWQDYHCSHFVSRSCMFLRFDMRNLKCACPHCNVSLYGNIPAYSKRLDSDKEGLSMLLMEESNLVYKWSRHELQNMIDEYRTKVNNLLKQIKQ